MNQRFDRTVCDTLAQPVQTAVGIVSFLFAEDGSAIRVVIRAPGFARDERLEWDGRTSNVYQGPWT